MKSDFLVALTQLAAERGLPREIVLTAIEAGLVSAYRKDSITAGQNVTVRLDPGSGDVTVFILKTVVEEDRAAARAPPRRSPRTRGSRTARARAARRPGCLRAVPSPTAGSDLCAPHISKRPPSFWTRPRSRIKPWRMRVFTVPSGSTSRSAISRWLSPS